MQQPASTQPSPPFSDFAGLLATLTSPPPDASEETPLQTPLWSNSDLGEDVATLSYEQALRARTRYLSANRSDALPMPLDRLYADVDADVETDADVKAAIEGFAADNATAQQLALASDGDLRSASVTIRLSKTECARLRQRAAQAGLTMSAYLRSCALEAETLRAQVKQALAEIKAGSTGTGEQATPTAKPSPRCATPAGSKDTGWRKKFNWIARFSRMRR
jgi:predicted DNA binding CopG/RHH family protein